MSDNGQNAACRPRLARNAQLEVAGWHERISLPDLGIESAYAKLDTGADTCSLQARDIVLVEGNKMVEFTAPLLRNQTSCKCWPAGGVRRVRALLVDRRMVRSSIGKQEPRMVIQTRVVLGDLTFKAHFSLTSREAMRFPILLGRNALSGRVFVDSAQGHLLTD